MDITELCGVKDGKVTYGGKNYKSMTREVLKFGEAMAKKNQSSAYYREKRNASKPNQDIMIGKMGECFAYLYFKKKFGFPKINLKELFDVRQGSQKGWEIDLWFNQVDNKFPNVHVKTCSDSTYRYCQDYSWTFQYSNDDGKGGKDDIFSEFPDRDLVAFVHVPNLDSNFGTVKAVIPVSSLSSYYKLPIKESLRKFKRCVYYNDLLEGNKMDAMKNV